MSPHTLNLCEEPAFLNLWNTTSIHPCQPHQQYGMINIVVQQHSQLLTWCIGILIMLFIQPTSILEGKTLLYLYAPYYDTLPEVLEAMKCGATAHEIGNHLHRDSSSPSKQSYLQRKELLYFDWSELMLFCNWRNWKKAAGITENSNNSNQNNPMQTGWSLHH